MFCKKCGKQLEKGTSFCPKCGTPITPKDPPKVKEEPKAEKATLALPEAEKAEKTVPEEKTAELVLPEEEKAEETASEEEKTTKRKGYWEKQRENMRQIHEKTPHIPFFPKESVQAFMKVGYPSWRLEFVMICIVGLPFAFMIALGTLLSIVRFKMDFQLFFVSILMALLTYGLWRKQRGRIVRDLYDDDPDGLPIPPQFAQMSLQELIEKIVPSCPAVQGMHIDSIGFIIDGQVEEHRIIRENERIYISREFGIDGMYEGNVIQAAFESFFRPETKASAEKEMKFYIHESKTRSIRRTVFWGSVILCAVCFVILLFLPKG
ncbi:MAG: zinc-ribbon domain-containing protein [Ruthenibacterium sp.]